MDPSSSDPSTSVIRRFTIEDGEPLQSERVRKLMRHVVHPVAIITSTDVSISPEGAPVSWKGATVSSFNTVTLSPVPIVSFNIKKLSSTYEAIKNSGLFYAHLLDCTNISVKIARKFSMGNKSSPFNTKDGSLNWFARKQLAKKQLTIAPGRSRREQHLGREPPLIDNYPQFQCSLRCQHLPQKTVEIEDHVVVFGQVTETYAEISRLKQSSVFMYYIDGKYCPPVSATESGNIL